MTKFVFVRVIFSHCKVLYCLMASVSKMESVFAHSEICLNRSFNSKQWKFFEITWKGFIITNPPSAWKLQSANMYNIQAISYKEMYAANVLGKCNRKNSHSSTVEKNSFVRQISKWFQHKRRWNTEHCDIRRKFHFIKVAKI